MLFFFFVVHWISEFGSKDSDGNHHASHPTVWNPKSKDFLENKNVKSKNMSFIITHLGVNMLFFEAVFTVKFR